MLRLLVIFVVVCCHLF